MGTARFHSPPRSVPRNQSERAAFGFLSRLRRMISLPRLSALFAAAVLAVPLPLRAHDPSECWAEVIVRANEMEVLLTMAQVTALRLVDPAKKIAQFTEENFATHRPRLLKEGETLFAITALKTNLPVSKVEVELSEELDIAYRIVFPRPAPGLVVIDAAFLKKLGQGFGGVIDASDSEGHHLGWDQISSENSTLVVMLPKPGAPADSKKK